MIDLETFRVFLHVVAASVWVGGQISFTWLMPATRDLDSEAVSRLIRSFTLMAWPAYGLAVVTGLWSVLVIPLTEIPHPEIEVKLLVVTVSGFGALIAGLSRGNAALVSIGSAAASLFGAASIWVGVAMPL